MKTTPMWSFALPLVLVWATSASALGHTIEKGRSFLAGTLHPEVVANTLVRVQDDWIAEAAAFADCRAKHEGRVACGGSQQSFGQSCTKVVDGILQGSSGDQNRVRDYMDMVCAQKSLTGVHHQHCLGLRQAIDGALQFNEFSNRMHFNSAKLCTNFWSTFAEAEQKRAEAERAAEKEMLIRANEHAKTLAETRRKEAKALAERRRKEQAHQKALEAKRQAVEAQEKAAKARKEAAERLARKKAEAAAVAAEAQEKVKKAAMEADKAAEEHQQRQLEHKQAEERLRNITLAHQKAGATNTSIHPPATAPPPANSSHQADPLVKALAPLHHAGEIVKAAVHGIITEPLKLKIAAIQASPKKQL